MSVISLIVILLVLAGILWLINSKELALNATMRMIINIAVIAVAIILVLSAFGVWQEVRAIQVPKL